MEEDKIIKELSIDEVEIDENGDYVIPFDKLNLDLDNPNISYSIEEGFEEEKENDKQFDEVDDDIVFEYELGEEDISYDEDGNIIIDNSVFEKAGLDLDQLQNSGD